MSSSLTSSSRLSDIKISSASIVAVCPHLTVSIVSNYTESRVKTRDPFSLAIGIFKNTCLLAFYQHDSCYFIDSPRHYKQYKLIYYALYRCTHSSRYVCVQFSFDIFDFFFRRFKIVTVQAVNQISTCIQVQCLCLNVCR